jgi:hypothetical protein
MVNGCENGEKEKRRRGERESAGTPEHGDPVLSSLEPAPSADGDAFKGVTKDTRGRAGGLEGGRSGETEKRRKGEEEKRRRGKSGVTLSAAKGPDLQVLNACLAAPAPSLRSG